LFASIFQGTHNAYVPTGRTIHTKLYACLHLSMNTRSAKAS
jgi:hypothetical protein